jgi:hypothetical protein
MSTKAEKRHMGRIAAMGCICCRLMGVRQDSKTDVHHIREDREARNDFLTLPLCHDSCHQGPLGVHGDGTFLRILKLSEWGLLAVVMEELEATA